VSEAIGPAPRAPWRRILPRRVSTWLMTIWTTICAVWIIGAVAAASGDEASADCTRFNSAETCDAAGDLGAGIGVGLIILLWFVVFAALALVALLTRNRA
jgi:hypothetical protein